MEAELTGLLNDIFDNVIKLEERSLKRQGKSRLSITETHIINKIGMHTRRRMSDIASELGVTLGTLTVAAARLEEKGFIIRERITDDRRVVLVSLTRRGRAAYRIHSNFHSELTRNILLNLDEEQRRILLKTVNNLDEFLKNYP